MKRALVIRHHESETMGANFEAILRRRGFQFVPCNLFESSPRFDRFDAPPPMQVDLIDAGRPDRGLWRTNVGER